MHICKQKTARLAWGKEWEVLNGNAACMWFSLRAESAKERRDPQEINGVINAFVSHKNSNMTCPYLRLGTLARCHPGAYTYM